MLKDTMPLSHQPTMAPQGPTVIPPTTKPYSLPLSREAFSTALRIGHGRAFEHAAAFGIDDRIDDVLFAMLYTHAWDPQIDSDRDEWIMSIVQAANAQDVLVPRFLELVNRPHGAWRSWADHTHRSGILLELAKASEPDTKEILYQRLIIDDHKDYVIGAGGVLWLDGPVGLVRLITKIAMWHADDPSTPLFESYLRIYKQVRDNKAQKQNTDQPPDEDNPRVILAEARHTNEYVDRWLNDLKDAGLDPWEDEDYDEDASGDELWWKEFNAFRERVDKETRGITAKIAIERIEQIPANASHKLIEKVSSPLSYWALSASTRKRKTVAEALSRAASRNAQPSILRGYLRLFIRQGLPIVTPEIIGLLDHPNEWVRRRAIQTLSHARDQRIRAHAIEKLRQPSPDFGLIQLLQSNDEPGDAAFLESLLVVSPDVEVMDTLCYALRKVFTKETAGPEAAGLMRFIYEHDPHDHGRRQAYGVLESLGLLPDWIQSEVAHDVSDHFRCESRPGHADA